jgi:hypothetical protein
MVCTKGNDNPCPVTDFRITWCPESCEFNKQIPKNRQWRVKTIAKDGAAWITETETPPNHMGEQPDGSFVKEISGVSVNDDHDSSTVPDLTEEKLWELVDISNDKIIRNDIIRWIWSLPLRETTTKLSPVNPPINFHPCSGCGCMLDDNLGCPEMKTCLEYHMCKVAKISAGLEMEKILGDLQSYNTLCRYNISYPDMDCDAIDAWIQRKKGDVK